MAMVTVGSLVGSMEKKVDGFIKPLGFSLGFDDVGNLETEGCAKVWPNNIGMLDNNKFIIEMQHSEMLLHYLPRLNSVEQNRHLFH